MVFAPTPLRQNLPAQLLSLSSITSTVIQQPVAPQGSSGSISITTPPTTGTVATALLLVGTVLPSATAVQVGLSSSVSTAPSSWVPANVSGTGWTASLTPTAAGTFYIWAEQVATPSVQAISAAVTVTVAATGSIAITNPPTTGSTSAPLALAGTVSPSGGAVRVGFTTSASVAPTNWINATVSGTGWTASVSVTIAGAYYIWAQQTSNTGVQAVSAAVTVSSAGAALSYSLITGSGNASLTGTTLVTTASGSAPAVDWTSSIVHASTDVAPNATLSAIGSITAGKFWFDTNNTGVTPGTFGNALFNGNLVAFYPFVDGFGTPTCVPAAPATAGTYYGKYAFYNTGGTMLGVFTTSAITVI